jgi:hypothetical protein
MRREIKRTTRRGSVMIWAMVSMVVLCGFVSLAVDLGRVQLTKTELRMVADSSARAGASAMRAGSAEAVTRARSIAQANKVDGGSFDLDPASDIQFVLWDTATRSYGPASFNTANAVRVVARKSTSRGNGIRLFFASILGQKFCNASGEAVVMFSGGVNIDDYVPGTANPFLAGMPAGSIASVNNPHKSPDYAGTTDSPRQSPLAIDLRLSEGMILTFDSITGDVRHDPNLPYFSPDGELTDIGHNTAGSENGIADVTAPINALVGLFLTEDRPSLTKAPKALDFTSDESRDFSVLQPQLKQIFFIGDGKMKDGRTQQFIVPKGATRLYLATWDFFEWNNNAGSRNVKVINPDKIVTVK